MPGETKPPSSPKEDRMQRLRVGLTGLAVVALIVMITTFVFSRIGARPPEPRQPTVEQPKTKAQDEPLAELGIAPAKPDNSAQLGAKAGQP